MRRAEPTDEELRRAWLHWKRRARSPWPETFEEAMAHPTLSRLVRMTAIHPPYALRQPAEAATTRHLPPAPRLRAPAVFDRKRAAAGDRDD